MSVSVTIIYYFLAPEPLIIDLIVTMQLDVINIFPLPIEVLGGTLQDKRHSQANSSLFFLFSPIRLSSQKLPGPSVVSTFQ